jgi:hypothetical protein
MLYLNLNQACANYTGCDMPNELIKMIYDYVITHKNKENVTNILSIIKDDFVYYEEIKNKKSKELMSMPHHIKGKKGTGKNGTILKEDCINALYYNDKIAKTKNTKKYISKNEHRDLWDENIKEMNDYENNLMQQIKNVIKNNTYENPYEFNIKTEKLCIVPNGIIDREEMKVIVANKMDYIRRIICNSLSNNRHHKRLQMVCDFKPNRPYDPIYITY